MEDISDELFENILNVGKQAQEDAVKKEVEAAQVVVPVTLKLSKYFVYLELHSDITLWVGRMLFDAEFCKVNAKWAYLLNPLNLVSQLSVVDELKEHKDSLNAFGDTDMRWLCKRITTGWNSGIKINQCTDLIKLANLRSQIEFVPHTLVEEGKDVIVGILNKLRLSSVPFLPGRSVTKILNNIYEIGAIRREDGSVTGRTGILVRPVPSNLLAAFATTKVDYIPFTIGSQMLQLAQKVLPNMVSIAVLDLIFKNNVARFDARIKTMDVGCWEYILPAHNQRSLFSGPVHPQWNSFFHGFSFDAFGPISADRVLAALSVKGYVGPVNSVALYCNEPRSFKCPNKIQCITEHVFISEYETATYPPDYCYYGPAPSDLNLALAAKKFPQVLALPLTGVLSGCPQVQIFATYHGRVSLEVFYCDPPLAVFGPVDPEAVLECGIPGGNILDQIGKIEKGFVKGFLTELVERACGDFHQGFRIDHRDNTYHVTHFSCVYPNFCGRYMALSKKEKERYAPSVRFSDVSIDGKRLHEEPVAIMQGYPRVGVNYQLTAYQDLEYGCLVRRENGVRLELPVVDPKLHMWDTDTPKIVPAMGIKDKLKIAREKREARANAAEEAKHSSQANHSSPAPAANRSPLVAFPYSPASGSPQYIPPASPQPGGVPNPPSPPLGDAMHD